MTATLDIFVIREQFKRVRDMLALVQFSKSTVIEDYPMGGSHRGQCRLEYDINNKKGRYRLCKTTSLGGRWNKPNKSTFRDFSAVSVVTGPLPKHNAAWLHVGRDMVGLIFANYESYALAESPYPFGIPRRVDKPYTLVVAGEEKHYVDFASKPEIIAAYDEYTVELCQLILYCAERGADTMLPADVMVSAIRKVAGL
jgi:hypothetical protein